MVPTDSYLGSLNTLGSKYEVRTIQSEATFTFKDVNNKYHSTGFYEYKPETVEVDNNGKVVEERISINLLIWHILGHSISNTNLDTPSDGGLTDDKIVSYRQAIGFENFIRDLLGLKLRTATDHKINGEISPGKSNYYFEKADAYSKEVNSKK